MSGFRVSKETAAKPRLGRTGKATLCALLGVTALTSASMGREYNVAGGMLPIQSYVLLSKEDAVQLVDTLLQAGLSNRVLHDVPVSLTDKTVSPPRRIIFTADGYDETNRIAYELIDSHNYGESVLPEELDSTEMGYAQNGRFGEWHILLIPKQMEIDIRSTVNGFLAGYTNRGD